MQCGHCRVEFHDNPMSSNLGEDIDGHWFVIRFHCPVCKRSNFFLAKSSPPDVKMLLPIWPRSSGRPPCPPEVPAAIAEDYTEACLVLPDSPKASAALSRRCLQNLLRDAAGVKHGDLANEIQQVIDKGALPSNLAEAIDAIRNVGNFAAHPTKSKSTGEIVPVEPHEAEWNLEVLEELFDHYYEKPAKIAAKRAALDAKLADAGKPPLK